MAVKTTLKAVPGLVDGKQAKALARYGDQPALVLGTLTADGHLSGPRVYIRVRNAYVCIYGCERPWDTLARRLTDWLSGLRQGF